MKQFNRVNFVSRVDPWARKIRKHRNILFVLVYWQQMQQESLSKKRGCCALLTPKARKSLSWPPPLKGIDEQARLVPNRAELSLPPKIVI
jgi:hypothetical protein